ncbi:MAG: hypothetical protein WA125_09170 [Desulfosporosinus sp.]
MSTIRDVGRDLGTRFKNDQSAQTVAFWMERMINILIFTDQ